MAQDDFYSGAARQRLNQIDAERQAALADLAAHRANGDLESAANAVQQLADLDAARQNLVDLHQRYVASMQPPQQPELSAEERHARPWHRMDANDVLDMAKTSKYENH